MRREHQRQELRPIAHLGNRYRRDRNQERLHYSVKRTPANAWNGAAGLWKRLSTPGPLVTAPGGMPGAPTPVGSLKSPKLAYLRSSRLLIEANSSRCALGR